MTLIYVSQEFYGCKIHSLDRSCYLERSINFQINFSAPTIIFSSHLGHLPLNGSNLNGHSYVQLRYTCLLIFIFPPYSFSVYIWFYFLQLFFQWSIFFFSRLRGKKRRIAIRKAKERDRFLYQMKICRVDDLTDTRRVLLLQREKQPAYALLWQTIAGVMMLGKKNGKECPTAHPTEQIPNLQCQNTQQLALCVLGGRGRGDWRSFEVKIGRWTVVEGS